MALDQRPPRNGRAGFGLFAVPHLGEAAIGVLNPVERVGQDLGLRAPAAHHTGIGPFEVDGHRANPGPPRLGNGGKPHLQGMQAIVGQHGEHPPFRCVQGDGAAPIRAPKAMLIQTEHEVAGLIPPRGVGRRHHAIHEPAESAGRDA